MIKNKTLITNKRMIELSSSKLLIEFDHRNFYTYEFLPLESTSTRCLISALAKRIAYTYYSTTHLIQKLRVTAVSLKWFDN